MVIHTPSRRQKTAVGDELVCTATVTDANGASMESSTSVFIENTAPVVSSTTISPNTGVLNTSSISCTATSSDIDETVSTTYSWTQNGTEIASGATIVLSDYAILPDDTISCIASATDSNGGSSSDSTSITVENRAPTISSPILSNLAPEANETVTCAATVSDDDGEILAASYSWEIDGAVIEVGSSITLEPDTALVGSTLSCTASVSDNDGESASCAASGSMPKLSTNDGFHHYLAKLQCQRSIRTNLCGLRL